MANKLNWQIGHSGKGNVYDDGSITTWCPDPEGHPHHQQQADADDKRLVFLFYITPEGGLNDGGVGFHNRSPWDDQQMIGNILKVDPDIYDATDDPLLESATPRYETEDGGYGHAYNLLNTFSRIAHLISAEDKSNWADFHTEFKIPRHVRREIRQWVDKLEWPEGGERADARRYHITVLSMDEYCPEFEKWARDQVKGRTFEFKSTGMDIFKDSVVLRLECPAWERLAVKWGEEAYNRGLKPRRFPGGPKCHISVGTTVDGVWPQGVPDPHIEFDTGRFNVNKNSKVAMPNSKVAMPRDPEWLKSLEIVHEAPTPDADGRITAYDHSQQDRVYPDQPKEVGHLWYSGDPRDMLSVEHLWTDTNNQHRGLASELMGRLEKQHPGAYIYHGERSPEGHGWATEYYGLDPDEEVDDEHITVAPYEGEHWLANRLANDDQSDTQPQNESDTPQTATDVADELKEWLDTIPNMTESDITSIHHTSPDQIVQQTPPTAAQGHFIDPPSNPYEPYDWAADGPEISPLDLRSSQTLPVCSECGHAHSSDVACPEDQSASARQFDEAQAEWYDRAWSEPGDALPWPPEEYHYKHDHAPNVSLASDQGQAREPDQLDPKDA